MIRVPSRFHPVGEWSFAGPGPASLPARLEAAAEVLARHELLTPRTVRLHRPERLDLDLPPGASLSAALRPVAGPLDDLDILGDGVVLDAHGRPERVPDVTWLSGNTYGEVTVLLCTQIDVWMVYGLDARPQPEVHARNAPRLEAALRDLRDRLGVEPDVERTRFAVPTATGLDNQYHADGSPVDCSIAVDR